MAEISAAAVRALRERTDLPLMDCKRALTEADGNEEKAVEILKKQGLKAIDKRKDNATSEGRIRAAVSDDQGIAAMIELQCESAPVAKSDDFLFLADQLVKQLLVGPGAATPEELLKQPVPDRAGMTLQALLEEVTNKIREKIILARVLKVAGPAGAYAHHDGKTGVLFQASGKPANNEVLRDVAMHVAAMRPSATLPAELDTSLVDAEKKRLTDEAVASKKPANIIEKMVEGRMKVFYAEKGVLIEQPFAKDDSKTVGKALADAGLNAVKFTRWVLGTG
ncbi:MAG: translation elongation factor Ts [Planctomycetales bacterium]